MNCPSCGRVVFANKSVCLCGWKIPTQTAAHYHHATPRNADQEIGRQALARIAAMLRPSPIRRSVFLPGESYNDFLDAWAKSEKSRGEFEAMRLVQNGWTLEKELRFAEAQKKCGMYFAQEMTAENLVAANESKREREAIQQEGA